MHRKLRLAALTLTILGLPWLAFAQGAAEGPAPAEPRRLVLVGDSTVKNGSGRGDGGLFGWGQVLQRWFDPDCLVVENRARGGRSSRTYLTEGLWDEALGRLRPGDYVMIQFGHNDGGQMFEGDRPRASIKGVGDQTADGVVAATGRAETVHTYGWYLRRYVADAKAAGATPIVLSPVPRNIWRDGRVVRATPDYGGWAREAAEQAGAVFLDLNEIIAQRYEELGQEHVAGRLFTETDHTHTTREGAEVNAACVVRGVRRIEEGDLAECLKPADETKRFSLDGESRPGHVAVPPGTEYGPKRGYGYETAADGERAFSVALPEGVYRVRLTCGSADESTKTRVEAELRRRVLDDVAAGAGETATGEFYAHTRTPALRGGGEVRLKPRERGKEAAAWDGRLSLRFRGENPAVAAVEITPAPDTPTLFLLGDSTVADQPVEPWASWGQKLPRYFADRLAVANHAESGETIRAAWSAGRCDKVLGSIRPGDWLMVQFGHNDMKDESPGALDRYREGLTRLVESARARGATPVLVTPMERLEGVEAGTLGDYPEAVREVAATTGVALVDLHAASKRLYRRLGERLPEAFVDKTHHTDFGAELIAALVVDGVRSATPQLAERLADVEPVRL